MPKNLGVIYDDDDNFTNDQAAFVTLIDELFKCRKKGQEEGDDDFAVQLKRIQGIFRFLKYSPPYQSDGPTGSEELNCYI